MNVFLHYYAVFELCNISIAFLGLCVNWDSESWSDICYGPIMPLEKVWQVLFLPLLWSQQLTFLALMSFKFNYMRWMARVTPDTPVYATPVYKTNIYRFVNFICKIMVTPLPWTKRR